MSPRLRVLAALAVLLVTLVPPGGVHAAGELEEGVRLYEAGNYTAALPLLQQVVKADPGNGRAWTWLGATYLKLDRVPEARTALERAVVLVPQSPAAHFFLGLAYARLGETEKARAAFQKVLALEKGGEGYAPAAAQWIRQLAGAPAPSPSAAPAPVVGGASCPKPSPLPVPQPPAAVRQSGADISISDVEMEVDKEELVIIGDVDNDGDQDIREVRVQATGYGLNGRVTGRAVTMVKGTIESEDFSDFLLRLGTKPPAIWVKLEIVDYTPRRPSDPLDATLLPVAVQEYAALARSRVKGAATVVPSGPARRQTVCLRIADTGGFPLKSVRLRASLNGSAPGRTIQQMREADVGSEGAAVAVEWAAEVRVAYTLEVLAVTFGALPPLR